jgi:polyhydroxyalkanoic acid synthase PhaR subunit
MAEQADRQTPDFMQLWREWLTQSERQVNALMNEAMGSDAFSRSAGTYLEVNAAMQRIVGDVMQRYLTFMNMPSRADIMLIGDSIRALEERLAKIEEFLRVAIEVSEPAQNGAAPPEPARTRRPAEGPFAGDEVREFTSLPEELRR